MLKAKNLHKSHGALTVLSGISFSLERGQKVALVGQNGVGKTILMKILAGDEKPDAGTLEIACGVCIGYLPQDASILEDINISDYLRAVSGIDVVEKELDELSVKIGYPLIDSRYNKVRARFERLDGYAFGHRMETMLAGFGIERGDVNKYMSELSSGQKSKVILAGILLKLF